MAQHIYWNWEDDDLTANLNYRTVGLMEAGRYRGYEINSYSADLNLVLTHTNDHKLTKTDLSEVDRSVVLTKQGAVIQEDANVTLPITANSSGDPRIDLVIMEHQYVFASGGSTGTYLVIAGTPAASPVRPALTNAKIQTIIGQLYVPDGTTKLDDPGVLWTKEPVPGLAGVGNIAYLDVIQTFSANQTFGGTVIVTGATTLNSTVDVNGTFSQVHQETPKLSPTAGTLTLGTGNSFMVDDATTDNFSNIATVATSEGMWLTLQLDSAITVTASASLVFPINWPSTVALPAGERLLLIQHSATAFTIKFASRFHPEKAYLAKHNTHTMMISEAKGTDIVMSPAFAANIVVDGNHFNLPDGSEMKWMETRPDGTTITIYSEGDSSFHNLEASPPAGFSKFLWFGNSRQFQLPMRIGTILQLTMVNNIQTSGVPFWSVSGSDEWGSKWQSLVAASGWVNSHIGLSSGMQYRILVDQGRIEFRGMIQRSPGPSSSVGDLMCTLESGGTLWDSLSFPSKDRGMIGVGPAITALDNFSTAFHMRIKENASVGEIRGLHVVAANEFVSLDGCYCDWST